MGIEAAEGKSIHIVVAPTWIGDAAMSAPFFRSLRAARPGARIEAVASPWTADLIRSFPWVDEVHAFGGGAGRGKWRGFFVLLRRLGRGRANSIWVLPNSFRSALVAFLLGAKRRIGYATDARRWLLSPAVPRPGGSSPVHLIDYYLGLLESEGISASREPVRLPVPPEAVRFAGDWLSREAPGEGPLVGMHPGAFFGDSKTWRPESYAALARLLIREEGARIVLFGGKGEVELAERVRAAAGGALANLAGRDNLVLLPGLLASLDAFVSGDTGPLHVAALVGTPTVSLFGPTDRRRTAPRGPEHRVVTLDLECSPCFARKCPLGHHKCMAELTPGSVAEELRAVLRPHGTIAEGSDGRGSRPGRG